MESLNKANQSEQEYSDQELESPQLNHEYTMLLNKMQALMVDQKPPSREAMVRKKPAQVLEQSNVEDDAEVVWQFDGQVRHRLQRKALRDKNTVVDLKKRKEAVGKLTDFPQDRCITYMTKHAEQIFEPKRVITNGDWLKSFREPDQYFETYKNAKQGVIWIGPGKNKLYLFMMDSSFADEDVKKYMKYASAFFPGTEVACMREGMEVPGQRATKTNKTKIPKNFLKAANIRCRDRGDWMQYSTHGQNGLLKTLPRYKPTDAYCVIGLTNEDLYPQESWNFCFGWATYNVGVGAFSFCRYDPSWDGIEDENAQQNLLIRGCHIMAHEIGHMFGLKHCIYYECLMNGLMSAEEQRNGGIRILCPVCLKKLKQNLKFDTSERFKKLAAVCDELGFSEEANVYKAIVAASENCADLKTEPAPEQPLTRETRTNLVARTQSKPARSVSKAKKPLFRP